MSVYSQSEIDRAVEKARQDSVRVGYARALLGLPLDVEDSTLSYVDKIAKYEKWLDARAKGGQ